MGQRQVEFATYCIGGLSQRLGIPQPDVYGMLAESGILQDYIVGCYDVLHTFGRDYLMDDLVGLMRERGLLA